MMTKSALWMLVVQAGGLTGYLTLGISADKIGRRLSYSIYSFIMGCWISHDYTALGCHCC
jgi:hypothetical protein